MNEITQELANELVRIAKKHQHSMTAVATYTKDEHGNKIRTDNAERESTIMYKGDEYHVKWKNYSKECLISKIKRTYFEGKFEEINQKESEDLNFVGYHYDHNGMYEFPYLLNTKKQVIDFIVQDDDRKKVITDAWDDMVLFTFELKGVANLVDLAGEKYKEYFKNEILPDLIKAQQDFGYKPEINFEPIK